VVDQVLYTTEGESVYRWDIYRITDAVSLYAQIDMDSEFDMEIFTFTEAGEYWARLFATGEGSYPPWTYTYLKTDTIKVYDIPIANFEVAPLEVMLPDQPVHCYNYSENAEFYEWDFGDNTFSNEIEPLHYYTKVGEYYISLRAMSNEGCDAEYQYDVAVIVNGPGQLIMPNAFTPDIESEGDGILIDPYSNKVFLPIVKEGIGEYTLQIYNRYGVKVFESKDPDIGWTGYYNHELCDKGAYKYIVSGKYENGVFYKLPGNVILLY
jgi:PKD repeat protein